MFFPLSVTRERTLQTTLLLQEIQNFTPDRKIPLFVSITPILPDPGSVRHRSLPDEWPLNQSRRNFDSLFGHKKHRNGREREKT
ncbi:hypothetical protein CEXT_199021 [Caerostris extrusa]|uniref:Uncharacterized protein n=1 Tax=Caerostris extrusa TaxID=172846 RepID=A0AAV4WSI1_CAEEX|nr:hypothetical protein CEXT_199021 [Caerostris extrusa]